MENKYYIIPIEDLEILNYNSIVESEDSINFNNDMSEFVCKIKIGGESLPSYVEYTKEEIKLELQEPEWNKETID